MSDSPQNRSIRAEDLEFTMHAKKAIVRTVKDPYFRDSDPELMFKALTDEIRTIAFGDYLKRYIIEKTAEGRTGNDPDDDFFIEYLSNAFRQKGVPPSFTPTTSKIKALAKNWVTQRLVSRNVVLLLGFALEMSPEDVNDFLTKALKESKIDPKDTFEVICWYCYQYHLPYARFADLWERTNGGEFIRQEESLLILDSTVKVRQEMESIRNEKQLMDYLSRLQLTNRAGRQSIAARKQFDELYHQACVIVAEIKTEMEKTDAMTNAIRFADSIYRSDRLYDYEKEEKIRKTRGQYRVFTEKDISSGEVESILYSAIPKDRNGNLIPMKESLLNVHFSGKRLNRQHIAEILEGKGVISRFDIITLCFFIVANEPGEKTGIRDRYDRFVRKTNLCLARSDMGPLYVANPYESFVLMCMLTDDPMGSFSDVWELSYEAE